LLRKLECTPIGNSLVHTSSGTSFVDIFLVELQIKNKVYNVNVCGIDSIDFVIIGWDVISTNKILPNLMETIFDQTISFLKIIPELKKTSVLILGQDSTEIVRLHEIKDSIKCLGYEGIIVKEITDINIQSIEEKVNMLGSLSRFIICDNSIPSGHIDELKICTINRFITAVIQESGKGGSWMQADYQFDFNFIKSFNYENIHFIKTLMPEVIDWAEKQLKTREMNLNSLYNWRLIT